MANQSKTEDFYIIMEPGFESVCGFDPANVVMYKPYYAKGTTAKAYKCYKTQGPVGSNREYWNMVRREAQQKARESRCMVRSPKTGRLIRCENNCAQCSASLNGDIIKEKIDGLPEKCRESFRMSYIYSMRNEDIADVLGVSIRTVESHIYHALKILRNELKQLKK